MKIKGLFILMGLLLIFAVSCKKESMNGEEKMMMKEEAKPVTYAGYIMDTICGTSGKGMDGSDVANSPQDHTKHCLEVCAPGGFGIMTKEGGSEIYKYIKFDEAGSNRGLELIKNSTKEKGIQIEVKGTLSDDVLTVSSITEK